MVFDFTDCLCDYLFVSILLSLRGGTTKQSRTFLLAIAALRSQ